MKTLAKISGIAYLLIFISGFYSNFAILETLVNTTNKTETTLNIINNSIQYKNGLIGFLIMIVSDIVLIWSLFKLTEPINKKLSYIASMFRGFHALFFVIALYQLQKIYQTTNNANYSLDLENHATNLLFKFDKLWTIGLLFFGVHLLILGVLSIKSIYISKWIGYLLILAALGYFIDGFAKFFLTNYKDYKLYFDTIVLLTAVVGEFGFTIWLFIKGFSKNAFNP